MVITSFKRMTDEQRRLFDLLQKDREENARIMGKPSMEGVSRSVMEKYSESAHFVYELIQNADDAKASIARFVLDRKGLIFAHDGDIRFSISDPSREDSDKKSEKLGHINSITSIGNTAKSESKIGKFGIGFKSVFEYTNTPYIYDPPFMFRIERFVVPILLNGIHKEYIEGETLFYFPFNKENKQPENAYKEIKERLKELDGTLLFLNHLEKIEWKASTTSTIL